MEFREWFEGGPPALDTIVQYAKTLDAKQQKHFLHAEVEDVLKYVQSLSYIEQYILVDASYINICHRGSFWTWHGKTCWGVVYNNFIYISFDSSKMNHLLQHWSTTNLFDYFNVIVHVANANQIQFPLEIDCVFVCVLRWMKHFT